MRPMSLLDAQLIGFGIRAIVNAVQAVAYAQLACIWGDRDHKKRDTFAKSATDKLDTSEGYMRFAGECVDHDARHTEEA